MTDQQKHAARLREMAGFSKNSYLLECSRKNQVESAFYKAEMEASIAGAEALEAQGRWLLRHYRGNRYMIPFDRLNDWQAHILNAEAGEYAAVVPEWAELVPDEVVITGWER